MIANIISYALFAVGVLAIGFYFVRRRALGRDPSPAGVEADAALRRQLRLQLILGVMGFIGAAIL